jgi:hypothetical protein
VSIFIAWLVKALTSRTGIAIAVGFALITFASVQTMRLDHAKKDLAAARAALVNPSTGHTWQKDYQIAAPALATCNVNLANTTGALDRQNLAVDALKAEADRRRQVSAQALSTARLGAAEARRRADAILSAPRGPDACVDALETIRSAGR